MIPVNEIRDLLPKAGEAVAGLSHADFNWRPEPGAWSIAECLAHLNLSDEAYCNNIATAIRSGVPGVGPFQLGWVEARFAKFMEPPFKVKCKTPKGFQPGPEHNVEKVIEDWRRIHERFLELASQTDGLHLTKIRVLSPASSLFSVSLLGAFVIPAAHDRRHLWQISRLKSMLPKSSAASGS